ncbi:hypothetical protein KIPB_014307, partial [Kipferlia bialata]
APLAERLVSKQWAERKSAYDDIVAGLGDGTLATQEYVAGLPKYVSDTNASCLSAALPLIAFIAKDPGFADVAEPVCKAVIAKGITGRASTKEKAGEACMSLVECGHGPVLLPRLITAMGVGAPKNMLASIDTVTSLVSAFGVKEECGIVPANIMSGIAKGAVH